MSSKTKIVVLHMKEIIYTGIFLALGIILIIFLIILFLPDNETISSTENNPTPTVDSVTEDNTAVSSSSLYIPGIYNTEIVLNDQVINVEVIVDRTGITSIEMINISDSITTMYPLLEPAFDSLAEQIIETQSLDNITYQQESKYTTLVLLEAIRKSINKAQP